MDLLVRFFEDFMRPLLQELGYGYHSTRYPHLNVLENDKDYVVKIAVPGAIKERLSVDYLDDHNQLEIRGEMPKGDENDKLVYQELAVGKFKRKVSLPSPIEGDKIEANFKEGILTLRVPKKPRNVRRVEIED